jgi:glycosyltransferase 2 family protein
MDTSKRRALLMALRILVSASLLIYLLLQVEIARLIAIWRELLLPLLLLSIVLQIGGVFVSALKWWLLLRASGQSLPYLWTVRAYLIGQFFNNFLPTMIGGDAIRVYQLNQRIDNVSTALASVFVERLLGFAALTVIATGSLALSYPLLIPQPALLWGAIWCLLAAAAALVVALAAPLIARTLMRLPLPNVAGWRGKLGTVADTLSRYYGYRRALWLVILLSFGYQFVWIAANYAAARSLRLDLPFAFMALIVPLSDIVGLVPIFLNNLGAREGTFVVMLGQLGVGATAALALAFLIFLVRLAVSLLGGLLYLFGGLSGARRGLGDDLSAVQRARLAEKP